MATLSNAQLKKERERWLIEQARQRCPGMFPLGELLPSESPDWLIPSAQLGIEVSTLLPPVSPGKFSGPQLSSFQLGVVQAAQRRYYELASSPANVLVFFANEWRRKRDRAQMAEALARFVAENYPVDGESVTLDPCAIENWLDFVSVIRIAPVGGDWASGGVNSIGVLTCEHLAGRIGVKSELVPGYRRRLPDWSLWLLLVTEVNVLCSISVPKEAFEWQFAFDFDRALLFDWDRGVIELQRTTPVTCRMT